MSLVGRFASKAARNPGLRCCTPSVCKHGACELGNPGQLRQNLAPNLRVHGTPGDCRPTRQVPASDALDFEVESQEVEVLVAAHKRD